MMNLFVVLITTSSWTCLVVQWVRFCALNAGDQGLIPVWDTWSHILGLNIPQATTKTQCSQNKQKININFQLLRAFWGSTPMLGDIHGLFHLFSKNILQNKSCLSHFIGEETETPWGNQSPIGQLFSYGCELYPSLSDAQVPFPFLWVCGAQRHTAHASGNIYSTGEKMPWALGEILIVVGIWTAGEISLPGFREKPQERYHLGWIGTGGIGRAGGWQHSWI